MKTIIQGDLSVLKEYTYFNCTRCGWAGKAELGEYEYCGSQIEGDDWRVPCPCCGTFAYTIKDKSTLARIIKEENKIDNDYWEDR